MSNSPSSRWFRCVALATAAAACLATSGVQAEIEWRPFADRGPRPAPATRVVFAEPDLALLDELELTAPLTPVQAELVPPAENFELPAPREYEVLAPGTANPAWTEPITSDGAYVVPDVVTGREIVYGDEYGYGGPEFVGPGYPGAPCYGCPPWLMYDWEFFGGVSTFQDPLGGRDFASAGFQEGLFVAGPLSPYHRSNFEFGLRGVHTNRSGYGSDVIDSSGGRNQLYLTAGVSRRSPFGVGFQGGAAWDWLVDDYLVNHQTSRVRAELSFLGPRQWEIGFWGSGDVSTLVRRVGGADREFEAIDIYSLFVRRRLGGSNNRGWLGLTDEGELILGGESRIPLNHAWALALEGSRMFADGRRGPEAAVREGWALGAALVFRPGAGFAHGVGRNTPLFGVAGPSTYYTRANVVGP